MSGGESLGEEQLEFDWHEAVDAVPTFVSQFLIQVGLPAGGRPDEIHLIVGHANPPVIVSASDAGKREQLDSYGGKLPVKVYGRYVLTRARLEELRNVLNDVATKYDALDDAAEEPA